MVWDTILPSKSHCCFLDYYMAKNTTFNPLNPSGILLKYPRSAPHTVFMCFLYI